MDEGTFVDALMKTIKKMWPEATAWRIVDRFALGIPDVTAWVPMGGERYPWPIAIEAKALDPLMPDYLHRGRRTGLMLKHEFTGPQISTLRAMEKSGVTAMGLVRVSEDVALRILPRDLPAKTGNFTHEEMIEIGTEVRRLSDGVWPFWRA
jgi:hypothetical protein